MHDLEFDRFTKSSSYAAASQNREDGNRGTSGSRRRSRSYYVVGGIGVLLFCAVALIIRTDQQHEGSFDELVTTGGAVRRNFLAGATDIQVKSCDTEKCRQVKSYILNSLDESVDPCEDFYKFSCGNWTKHNPIPKTSSSFSTFSKLNQKVEKQLKAILEHSGKNARSNSMYQKAQNYYLACKDQAGINKLGAQPLLDLINKIDGWAMGGEGVDFDIKSYDVMKTLRKIQKGFTSSGGPLFSVHVSDDPKHTNKHIIEVS